MTETYEGVMAFAEQREGKLSGVSLELLRGGKGLKDSLKCSLSCALLGHGVEDKAQELFEHGADTVYLLEHPLLESFESHIYARAMEGLIRETRPEIVLLGSTTFGRELAPRLSTRLRTGLMADCHRLEIEQGQRLLLGIKPLVGTPLMATFYCPHHRPQMATVRPRVFEKPARESGRRGNLIRVEPAIREEDRRLKILATHTTETSGVSLGEAKVIVAGGLGLGKKENLRLIEELAKLLKGAVGVSRPCVDEGWLPYSHQVGQSGRTVRPELYIACGIHGDIFHTIGMRESKCIVAINTDPDAPIFLEASIGVVADLCEVIPALLERLKNQQGQ